jgi:hypothetical protein
MSWAHWPFYNCFGTLASQHCNNTLFKNGGSKPGALHPLPLILALSSVHIQNIDQNIKFIQKDVGTLPTWHLHAHR